MVKSVHFGFMARNLSNSENPPSYEMLCPLKRYPIQCNMVPWQESRNLL